MLPPNVGNVGNHGNEQVPPMPPRFAYWTIIVEGKPTAFRAQLQEELIPTFKQLQSKHPDAVMMWFARGRLWASQEESRAAEQRGGSGKTRLALELAERMRRDTPEQLRES